MFRAMFSRANRSRTLKQIRQAVNAYLHERFDSDSNTRITEDSLRRQVIATEYDTKLGLALNAANPAEHCIQNLIREIDEEAEWGVWLEEPAGRETQTRRLLGKPVLSGNLFNDLSEMSSLLFAGDGTGAAHDLQRAHTILDARYFDANVNAELTELTLMYLMADADEAAELADDLRGSFYTYHENDVRHRCGLPGTLDEIAAIDLDDEIFALRQRAGGHLDRFTAIRRYSEIV